MTPALVDQRAGRRHPVAITWTTVQPHGSDASQAVLHDLSIYGCRLQSPVMHTEGERLSLRLGAGRPIAATIIWCRDSFVGCRFDAPIGSALVRELTLEI